MNEALAIRKFKQNIYNEKIRLMAMNKDHTNLIDAIAHAAQKAEELGASNIEKELNSNKDHNNVKQQGDAKQNGNKNNGSDKNKKVNPKPFDPCTFCKKTNHTPDRCFHRNKNKSDKPPAEKKSTNVAQTRSDAGGELLADGRHNVGETSHTQMSSQNQLRLYPYLN